MTIKISDKIQKFWNEFTTSDEKYEYLKNYKFHAWSFGYTPELGNELCALVMEGKKTATCSLLRAYRGYEDEIPRSGLYSVLCDGNKDPQCIVFLTHTWVEKFLNIDEKHAFEEGEGDRSLEYWRKAHIQFFSEHYDNFSEGEELLCERFCVVYKIAGRHSIIN